MKTKLLLFVIIAIFSLSINAQITSHSKQSVAKIKHSFFKMQPDFIKNTQLSSERSIKTMQFKPGKQVDSNWDTTSNVWDYNDSICNSYNSLGNITQELFYYGGSTPDKRVYVYNGNDQLTSDSSMNWNGTTYVNNGLNTYAYDGNGNLSESINYYNWNGTAWDNANKNVYTYDGSNNLTENLYHYWNSSAWVVSYKTTYTWSGGQMTAEEGKYWNGSTWDNDYKSDYTYASGQCNSVTGYSWNGTSWQNAEKYIDIIWYQWNGNLDNSKPTSFTGQVPDGASWEDTLKAYWTYDSYGNQTDYLEQTKPGGTYITAYEEKNIYQYDGNNNITEDIYQEWNPPTQNVRNKYKREYYNFFQFSTSLIEITKDDNVLVYPNPFNTRATITFANEQKSTTIKIMDLFGKEVNTVILNDGNNLIIEKGEMKAGIYLLQIIDKNMNIINKKIVVQ